MGAWSQKRSKSGPTRTGQAKVFRKGAWCVCRVIVSEDAVQRGANLSRVAVVVMVTVVLRRGVGVLVNGIVRTML